jgi:ABC-type glycerol-3-phosphate transport system permease component
MTRSRPIFTTTVHLGLAIAAAVSLVPFAWLLCASLKTGQDLFAYTFLPADLRRITFENYRFLFQRQFFDRWIINSIFLASLQTVLVVAFASLGGFALAKYDFRFKRPLQLVMLGTMLLPSQVLLPSMYELMNKFGWVNQYWSIIVPGAVSVFGMFLFRQAMQGVPDELLQAARVDGCSELRLWWEIALPVVRPMIGAFTLMSFLAAWNSYLWPSIMLQDQGKYTLTMGLANMSAMNEYQTHYGMLMAGTCLSVLPIMVLFFTLQKDFIAGLTSGAVKG